MIKVLYCASVWVHLQNFHLPYIQEMEDAGYEVHIASSGIPEDTPFTYIHNLPIRKSILSPRNLYVIFQIVKLIRRERFDLIYVHTTLAAFLCRIALLVSLVPGVRLIYVCHGYFFKTNKHGRVKKDLRSLAYFLCEKLLAGLTPTLVLMNREDFASAVRYRLGTDIRFSHGMGLVPNRYTLPVRKKSGSDKIIFLCVGELSERKNQMQLLRAFALACKEMPQSLLWLAGSGSKRRCCEKLAEELGLTEHVRFFGHVQDVSSLYAAADVLVSASRCEGLPFCVMEGLFFGLPIIASDIKGHRDLIENNCNGMLYDLKTKTELAQYMIALGSSKENRRCLSVLSVLLEEYLIESTMEEFRQIIGMPVPFRSLEKAGIS